jgi:hypothetical protein
LVNFPAADAEIEVNPGCLASPQRNATLSTPGLLRSAYLLYFSQPAADRALYKALKGRKLRTIVQLGIGNGERTSRIIEVAGWEAGNLPLDYTGIDLFEQRPKTQPGLSLKAAFSKLKFDGVKVRLTPGDPFSALARVANQLKSIDLLLISSDQDADSMARAWFYVPRMIAPETLVLIEEPSAKAGHTFRTIKPLEVERLAAAAGRSMRRVA